MNMLKPNLHLIQQTQGDKPQVILTFDIDALVDNEFHSVINVTDIAIDRQIIDFVIVPNNEITSGMKSELYTILYKEKSQEGSLGLLGDIKTVKAITEKACEGSANLMYAEQIASDLFAVIRRDRFTAKLMEDAVIGEGIFKSENMKVSVAIDTGNTNVSISELVDLTISTMWEEKLESMSKEQVEEKEIQE